VLAYLSRYTHRFAISNSRLIGFDPNFCDRGRTAVEAHELRQAAVHPLRRWLAPTCLFGDSVESGKVGIQHHNPCQRIGGAYRIPPAFHN
jgi:hypothetical protein